jgi:hypothetical protein
MKGIHIALVDHQVQEYPTAGNWKTAADGQWFLTISRLGDWRYEFLVALHEQIEMALCKQRGISEAAVTEFDLTYEANRPEGDDSEPGHDPKAPYHHEHVTAEKIERLIAQELGVDWESYDRTVGGL